MPASVIPMATSGCLCSRSTSRTEFFKSQAGLLGLKQKEIGVITVFRARKTVMTPRPVLATCGIRSRIRRLHQHNFLTRVVLRARS
jgi:hypothetical protein